MYLKGPNMITLFKNHVRICIESVDAIFYRVSKVSFVDWAKLREYTEYLKGSSFI